MQGLLQVVAGILIDTTGAILIQERPLHKHLGGLWEFPGGKLETGETPLQALQRELMEELDILLIKAYPLMTLTHDYPAGPITLHAWRVVAYSGAAIGKEGQTVRWVPSVELTRYQFPAANGELITALRNE